MTSRAGSMIIMGLLLTLSVTVQAQQSEEANALDAQALFNFCGKKSQAAS